MTGNRESGARAGPADTGRDTACHTPSAHRAREAPDSADTREVACDESGSDGENLTTGNTDVFAHASVLLPTATAAGHVQHIRDRIGSPAEEYKAGHLLRERNRPVLEWLLAPSGPLHGRAHVHLVEKAYFVVDRAVGLLLGDPAPAPALFRAARHEFGPEERRQFLESANQLLRVRADSEPDAPVDAFYATLDALRLAHPGGPAANVLDALAGTRGRADAYRARVLAGPVPIPLLDPLPQAVVRTAAHWSAGGHRVRLVHDEQNMLTPERVALIVARARRTGVALDSVRRVDSRDDARVQLADFLAGIARKIASDELGGHGDPDPRLTALLRPYVGADSVWGDVRSRSRLGMDVAEIN
ncbi:DUF3800 domain-containing protein [Streptomyces sp. NPDC006458]|uniref:DUF3800 domain-containing protein n=1 Tax=Streptomyces sp. NPDC006458 TaxID=3154302 RepID=UPI0033AD6E66